MLDCFRLSLAQWRDTHLANFFVSSGLQRQTLQISPSTSVHIWIPSSNSVDKPALLLIHGFGTSPLWQWDHQIKPLSEKFRLFVPDLLFFGRSSTSSPHRSEIFQAQILNSVMESLHVDHYSVLGTSYGGFVAFRLAHLFPERVQKVILANSGACMTPKDNDELLKRSGFFKVSDLLLPQSPAALRTLMGLSIHMPTFLPSFILQDVINYFYIDNRPERIELLNGLQIGRADAEPLPKLTQKVLLIWGEYDGIFPPEMAHRLKGHLGQNAELVIFKNVAHCAQAENPKEFNKLVQNFVLNN